MTTTAAANDGKPAREILLTEKLVAETVGTFFVTLIPTVVDIEYFTTRVGEDVSRWLARGFIIAAMVYAFSGISRAHLNPAVSFGFAIRRLFALRTAILVLFG